MKRFILLFTLISFSTLIAQEKSTKENGAPVFVKQMPDSTLNLNKLYKFIFQASDPDGDAIKYFPATLLPNGASLDSITGEFRWTPTNYNVGKHEIIIIATDGKLITTSRKTRISITSYGSYANQITVICKPENGGRSGNILCNVGNIVSAKAWSNPGYSFMSWTENDSIVSKDSIYTFLVTKNRNLIANFRVNHAPVFIKEMKDTFIWAGRTLLFNYKATDIDGDSVTYSVETILPLNATFLPLTGVFSWRPFNAQRGMYELIVAASDGKLKTYSKRAILTTDYHIDIGPGEIHLAIAHNVGGEVTRSWAGDTAIVRAIPNKGYRFTNWTENGIVVSTDSIYKFVMTVSRSLLANFRKNHTPVFVKEMPDTAIENGMTYRFFYKAEDADGEKIKYTSVNPLPSGATLNDSTGLFTWRPKATQGGKHIIVVAATDGSHTIFSRKTTIGVYVHAVYLSVEVINNPIDGGESIPMKMYLEDIDTIVVTLKAIAKNGFRFVNWTEKGIVISSDSIFTFILNESKTFHANYSLKSSIEDYLLPLEFSLSQNYPNPFNPETSISYSIPKSEHVTLIVFDLLGRQVEILVDELKQAGTYKTKFNATRLESGVYFYQLTAGNYVQTKKLILIK